MTLVSLHLMLNDTTMYKSPCIVNDHGNDTTLNEHSWNNNANLLFLDQVILHLWGLTQCMVSDCYYHLA